MDATMNPKNKYKPFEPVRLADRTWPDQTITKAPVWCSVDLRDGNQSLINPMGMEKKLRFFKHLCDLGFKEIEVGFPASGETDFDFIRYIIDNDLIPEDVHIQVLTQAREELIERTVESVAGAKNVIIHLYNSTSTLQRRVVFGQDRDGIRKIAEDGTKKILSLLPKLSGQNVRLEYSPESFTGTELDYAADVCNSVITLWDAAPDNQVIINLPATVEHSSPNIYADQIEWMHRNLARRDSVILSLHPHNDRGTGVAAAEQGVMAGADRIEGTLFGNGERTGNVDVVTLALNMYTQGIDPHLDFSDIDKSIEIAEYCNELRIPERHPYAGELVFTAFSGSHQDAIRKGMTAMEQSNQPLWEVPYLPIDPADVGRSYEAIVRINSQSGKGGVAYILETEYGIHLPREWQVDFSKVVQHETDTGGIEMTPKQIHDLFQRTYISNGGTIELLATELSSKGDQYECEAVFNVNGSKKTAKGKGNGPINAFVHVLKEASGLDFNLVDYEEKALSGGSAAQAICFIKLKDKDGVSHLGIGINPSTSTAAFNAVIGAANRMK